MSSLPESSSNETGTVGGSGENDTPYLTESNKVIIKRFREEEDKVTSVDSSTTIGTSGELFAEDAKRKKQSSANKTRNEGDKESILEACSKNCRALVYDASEELKNDKELVLAACSQNGCALEFASEELRSNKVVVLASCSQDGRALQFTSEALKNDKEVVLAACSQNGTALQYASEELKNDKEIVLEACSHGFLLKYASAELKSNKVVVSAACSQYGEALKYASKELRNDKEVVLLACSKYGRALKYASEELRNDKEFVVAVCTKDGYALRFASQDLKNDKEIVLAACLQCGNALEHASEPLRADKAVVLVAVESNPESLKFALGGLNQDEDCLIKAGLWDEDYIDRRTTKTGTHNTTKKKKIVLSTKFSLARESSPHATRFTLELKKHPHIKNGNYVVYSPNAFNKGTCDPNWTDQKWPCKGTYDSCQKPHLLKTGVPQETECCWRYSFRYQLEEARRLGGLMIQVVDWDDSTWEHQLGDGQRIETEMAQDVGIKIFRFFEPHRYYDIEVGVDALVSDIDEWYNAGCSNMQDCIVKIPRI